MTRKFIAVASACAFIGTTFAATPVFAAPELRQEPGQEQWSMTIVVGDLNLQSERGARAALQRIKNASSVFCEDDDRPKGLRRKLETRKCRDRMMYLAVNKLDAPLVTQSYHASGARPPIQVAGDHRASVH